MSPKLWLVTGCSTGMGAALARAILGAGDRVVATARDESSLEPLREAGAICLQLDITASSEELARKVADVESNHGPVDVLVNNASYTQGGAVEELSMETLTAQFNTTFFGTVNTTKAFLPFFRRRNSGTIVMITSIDAHVGRASLGALTAAKHAVRGLTECLRHDIKPFNIRVIEVVPGMFRTAAITHRNFKTVQSEIPEYQAVTSAIHRFIDERHGTEPGDPAKLAQRVLQLVNRSDAFKDDNTTDFLPLGKDAWDELHESLSEKLAILNRYKDVICSTDFD